MRTFPRNYAATNGGERRCMTNFLLPTLLLGLALPAQATVVSQPAPVVNELARTLEQSVKGIMESRLQGGISIGRRGAAANRSLGGSDPIPRSLSTMSRVERIARDLRMNVNSATTRQVLNNLDMPVGEFVSRFRQGRVLREIPQSLLQNEAKVEQAIRHSSKVKKLLVDGRFAK